MVPGDISGKNQTVCLDSEELTVNVISVLGEHEESGCLGGMVKQGEEKPGIEGFVTHFEAEILTEEQIVQGIDLTSPVSKDLEFVWDVKGTAGLSCDGQVRKLKEVLGKIVAEKYGEGISLTRVEADGKLVVRDACIIYEALNFVMERERVE